MRPTYSKPNFHRLCSNKFSRLIKCTSQTVTVNYGQGSGYHCGWVPLRWGAGFEPGRVRAGGFGCKPFGLRRLHLLFRGLVLGNGAMVQNCGSLAVTSQPHDHPLTMGIELTPHCKEDELQHSSDICALQYVTWIQKRSPTDALRLGLIDWPCSWRGLFFDNTVIVAGGQPDRMARSSAWGRGIVRFLSNGAGMRVPSGPGEPPQCLGGRRGRPTRSGSQTVTTAVPGNRLSPIPRGGGGTSRALSCLWVAWTIPQNSAMAPKNSDSSKDAASEPKYSRAGAPWMRGRPCIRIKDGNGGSFSKAGESDGTISGD